MIKEKVLLAVDNIPMENYIMKQLSQEFEFCKPASYRNAVLSNIDKYKPNIVVIIEELKGKENLTKIIYEIFSKYPNIRVVFVANERQPGDRLISTLINYQVYDLIIGDEVNANEIIQKIRIKNNYHDVQHLHAVEIIDEEKGQMLFEAPNVEGPKEKIVEVIKEVYIETTSKNEPINFHKEETIIVQYVETSKEDEDLVIGNDIDGNNVLVKDVCPKGFFYYESYFFNQKDDTDYYYYHEGYFFNQYDEPYVNYEGTLITYDEYLQILNNEENELLLLEEENERKRMEQEFLKREQEILEIRKQEQLEEDNRLKMEQEFLERERLRIEEHEKKIAEQQALEIQKRMEEEKERERLAKEESIREEMYRREEQNRLKREEEIRMHNQKLQEEENKRLERIAYEESLKRKELEAKMKEQELQANKNVSNNEFKGLFEGKTQNQIMQALNTSNNKLITIVGAKPGTGATTIGFNLANVLAKEQKNVLYIEYNYSTPSIPFLYNLGYANKGIDSAIEGLKRTSLTDIEDAILRMSDLKKKKIEGNPFKVFSENLDILLFSKEFIINHTERVKTYDEKFFKELLLYFIFQSSYDFVILDIQMKPISNESMYQALFLSQKIFLVTLPDYTYVSYSTFHINEWMKKSILLNNRLHIIVNRYEKSKLTPSNLADWLEVNNLIVFPEATKQCIEANLDAIPVVLHNKKSQLNSSIAEVLKYLK